MNFLQLMGLQKYNKQMFRSSNHRQEEDSPQLEYPLWIPRQKSNDSIFGQLINAPVYEPREPFVFDYPVAKDQPNFNIFKPKDKKVKIKKPCDYRKNICGYITKKIIREYLSQTYYSLVQKLCEKHGCSYSTSKTYFLSKIERITGPSHVPSLFIAMEESEVTIKAAFKEFFVWFTKERYLRYLILEGKMDQKEAYIEYKNTILMSLVNRKETDPLSVTSHSDSNYESS